MQAIVVYESHWGCTAAVADAIADGLGTGARALTTDEATDEVVAAADLIVVGAPVVAFSLASDGTRARLASNRKAPRPADVAHPTMESWLRRLPIGHAPSAAFETRIWWSPLGAAGEIERGLRAAGHPVSARPGRFVVNGTYGPLRGGELERARAWGAQLGATIGTLERRAS
jgi:hypothetical protein